MSDVTLDDVPRSAKRFVGLLFVLLFVPTVIGFELWPMTAWRLFSLSRKPTQTTWQLDATTAEGEIEPLVIEELPLGYRNVSWVLDDVRAASDARREEVCQALIVGAAAQVAGAQGVVIRRVRERLVERDGEWTATVERDDVFHECARQR